MEVSLRETGNRHMVPDKDIDYLPWITAVPWWNGGNDSRYAHISFASDVGKGTARGDSAASTNCHWVPQWVPH